MRPSEATTSFDRSAGLEGLGVMTPFAKLASEGPLGVLCMPIHSVPSAASATPSTKFDGRPLSGLRYEVQVAPSKRESPPPSVPAHTVPSVATTSAFTRSTRRLPRPSVFVYLVNPALVRRNAPRSLPTQMSPLGAAATA